MIDVYGYFIHIIKPTPGKAQMRCNDKKKHHRLIFGKKNEKRKLFVGMEGKMKFIRFRK